MQWCHVQDMLIDNDLPCALWCPDKIRLAKQHDRCQDCIHFRVFHARNLRGHCALTNEMIPLGETCCHHNAPIHSQEAVVLRLGETVPQQLLQAHGIANIPDLFFAIESAPELPDDMPEDPIKVPMSSLALPLVYGVSALCWDKAIYGEDEWNLCPE